MLLRRVLGGSWGPGKQGESENPKNKPHRCIPIFNVRLRACVQFVIWVKVVLPLTQTFLLPFDVSAVVDNNLTSGFWPVGKVISQKTSPTQAAIFPWNLFKSHSIYLTCCLQNRPGSSIQEVHMKHSDIPPQRTSRSTFYRSPWLSPHAISAAPPTPAYLQSENPSFPLRKRINENQASMMLLGRRV